MGRPAKSNLEKFLTGNPGKRPPLLSPASNAPPGLPIMPTTLSDGAKRHWKRIGSQLNASGLVRKIDGTLFAILCETLADLELTTNQLREQGQTIMDSKGRLIRNPLAVSVQNLRNQVASLSDKFGLSPKSRNTFSNIEVADKPNQDGELADMLAGE